MPPKARKLPRRGWLDSLFSIEVGGLFPFHSLTPALSPMGFTHAARMSEEVGQWWGGASSFLPKVNKKWLQHIEKGQDTWKVAMKEAAEFQRTPSSSRN